MGVYINMEMLKDCEIYLRIDGKGEVYVYGTYPTELYKAVPVPPHGRLIDADEFLKRAIETKCFRGDFALVLEELVGESSTIIPE